MMNIHAVGQITLPQLNRYKNTSDITAVPNVLETIPLTNFGVTTDKYTADPVTFTVAGIVAVVITNDDEIVDYRLVSGSDVDLTGGVLTFSCWTLAPACCDDDEPSVDIDLTLIDDPCAMARQFRLAVIKAKAGSLISWRNADRSETRSAPNIPGLQAEYLNYQWQCDGCPAATGLDIVGRG